MRGKTPNATSAYARQRITGICCWTVVPHLSMVALVGRRQSPASALPYLALLQFVEIMMMGLLTELKDFEPSRVWYDQLVK